MSPVTAIFLVVFASIGAWWGWRYTSVAILTDTAPKWRRGHGVRRRDHAKVVRRRRALWRWAYTLICTLVGACVGYVALRYAPMLNFD